jgi:hypothetical protein
MALVVARATPCTIADGGIFSGLRTASYAPSEREARTELGDDFAANEEYLRTCDKCQECRAANALHENGSTGRYLASLDIEMQGTILAWDRLDRDVREALCELAMW